jgi:Ca2+-binding RTX toxin-like protein
MARRIRESKDGSTKFGTGGDDILSGMGVSFELIGGKGDDTYYVDDAGDKVVEKDNGGTDHVYSYMDFVLGTYVENLTLEGGDSLTGTGNDSDNIITGNSGDNTLSGLGGDDTLDGGDGSDTAVFAGTSSEYVIERVGDDLRVTHKVTGETDILRNIEFLEFDDKVIAETDIGDGPVVPPAPQATADTAAATEDNAVVIAVLANDSGEGLTIASVANGGFGEVAINNVNRTVTYTPDADANGQDIFAYTITDSSGQTSTAEVTVYVSSVNDAPIANDDSYSATGGVDFTNLVSVLDNDSDPDGDILTITAYDATSQSGRSVSMNADGTFTYSAASGYTGTDSFSYTIDDGNGGQASALVTISVNSPPDDQQASSGLPDYVLSALLPAGSGDTTIRWNSDDPLGSSATITYSFLQEVPEYYGDDAQEHTNFQPFTQEQEDAVRYALEIIEGFTNTTFVETTNTIGDITFGTADLPYGSSYAYMPVAGSPLAGDVWLDNLAIVNDNPEVGGDGFKAILHEIGHALGLEHPLSGELPADELNRKYTVMSYASHPDMLGTEPSSYMLYDIAALQYLYGQNFTASLGNNVYDFSTADGLVTTLWDSGGWDVLDASGSTHSVVIDLNAGAYSSLGTVYGSFAAIDNIAIAYGTVLEEARGGTGDDFIIGNSANNRLSGGAGADEVYFAAQWGSDVIVDFEDGIDLIDLSALSLGFGDLVISEENGSAVIGYNGSDITLEGVWASALDESDFLFGGAA